MSDMEDSRPNRRSEDAVENELKNINRSLNELKSEIGPALKKIIQLEERHEQSAEALSRNDRMIAVIDARVDTLKEENDKVHRKYDIWIAMVTGGVIVAGAIGAYEGKYITDSLLDVIKVAERFKLHMDQVDHQAARQP